jgi:hypothetical protein
VRLGTVKATDVDGAIAAASAEFGVPASRILVQATIVGNPAAI